MDRNEHRWSGFRTGMCGRVQDRRLAHVAPGASDGQVLCWVYCPESAIIVKDGRWVAFDYDHCKGCGICGAVCPVKVEAHEHTGKPGEVIQMVLEGE
jgi:MinD superfamily P-loop ATPase